MSLRKGFKVKKILEKTFFAFLKWGKKKKERKKFTNKPQVVDEA